MFNGNNSTPFSMPVAPIGYGGGNSGGMGGWNSDWIALAILALIFGDGWGMGGMGGMGMFLPFMFMNGGWGGFGGNFGGNGGALTRGELCQDMNFQSLENAVRGVNQGLCDGFYAVNTSLLNGFHGVDNAICTLGYQNAQGFAGVDNAICSLGYNVQQGFNNANVVALQNQNALQAQIANCCCDNRVGQMQIQNQMQSDTCALLNQSQTNTRDIIDNQNAGTRAILDYLCQKENADLRAENQALRLEKSQTAQNAFIAANQQAQTSELIRRLGADCPQPAYVVQPPQSVSFPLGCNGQLNVFGNNGYGYNNGCGCNSGCCGCNA